jgi:hypothetical protein
VREAAHETLRWPSPSAGSRRWRHPSVSWRPVRAHQMLRCRTAISVSEAPQHPPNRFHRADAAPADRVRQRAPVVPGKRRALEEEGPKWARHIRVGGAAEAGSRYPDHDGRERGRVGGGIRVANAEASRTTTRMRNGDQSRRRAAAPADRVLRCGGGGASRRRTAAPPVASRWGQATRALPPGATSTVVPSNRTVPSGRRTMRRRSGNSWSSHPPSWTRW